MKFHTVFNTAFLTSSVLTAFINSNTSKTAKPMSPIDTLSSEKASNPGINPSNQNGLIVEREQEEVLGNLPEMKPSVQCSTGDYHISSASELQELYQCDDVIGSVFINNYHGATIDTGPIQTISGDLVISNASNLVRINTPKLAIIGGKFSLNELTSLTSVHSPFLNTVGTIDWRILPILSTISFEHGIKKVESIIISDTSLTAFSGFDSEVLNTLNINNNRFLESITSGLAGIDEELTISANAKNIMVSLPELKWANNITIRDVSSLDLSSIEDVNASLELINNNFQTLKLPKLKEVGGSLSIIENFNLKDLEFPSIEEIEGGLMIVNNSMLNKINFFPKLKTIGGAIEFIGDFKETSFNKLTLVKGSALINTIADSFDCAKWTRGNENTGSIIRGGKIVCKTGDKQHIAKYNQDGELVDEAISIVEEPKELQQKSSGTKLVANLSILCLILTYFLI